MRQIFLTIISIILTVIPFALHAAQHEPYRSSRIFWDNSTRKTVFSSGGYPRLIELADDRLMAAVESSGINIAFSSDKGSTWSSPVKIVTNTNNTPNCVPDLIQLADGTIIVAYNPRPNTPYTDDRHFGIRCKRSTDGGNSWSDEIWIYDASYTFSDGCWEPSMLQLPSGEIQLYFADEGPYTSSDEQQISMCRSYDSGQTWTFPQRVAFRSGYRDGMPSAILLSDNATIALAFEDNGWSGVGNFIPTVVTCPLAKNWNDYYVSGDDANRWQAVNYSYCSMYKGGAPYLRKLPWGETIISHQGEGNDLSALAMIAYVGNTEAKDFKAMTFPFGTDNSLWNSLAVIDTGTVVAIGGMSGRIDMIKGRAIRQFEAPFAHPIIDGKQTSREGYLFANATQMILGHSKDKVRFTADFAYDKDSLYFTSRVSDITPYALKNSYGDGITLFLDCNYASEQYPVDGIHRIMFRRDSTFVSYQGKTSTHKWGKTTLSGVHYVLKNAARYYIVEAAIAWKDLGFSTAPVGNMMRVNVMLQDNQDGGNVPIFSMMPDAQRDASWTWMDFVLLPSESTSINDVNAEVQSVKVMLAADQINIVGNVVKTQVYSADGRLCGVYKTKKFAVPMRTGIIILHLTTEQGAIVTRKLFVK